MNRIKIFFWTMLFAISLGGTFGCKKFLDRKPLSATLDDIPGGGIEGQILGLYGAIRHPDASGNGFGGIMWLGMHSARGDDAVATASSPRALCNPNHIMPPNPFPEASG